VFNRQKEHTRLATNQASVGDALIFMTKAVVGGMVLIALVVIGSLYLAEHNSRGRQINVLRVEKASLQGTIDDLGEKLNACFQAGAGREWTDAELDAMAPCPTSAPCKPWERAWWPYDPAPPPGFVIKQPGQRRNLLADE
jgi:hypothetical protein